MILCDTSGLLALLDSGEREHRRASAALEDVTGPLLTTDFVLAELDYLILRRLGPVAETALLKQVRDGSLTREPVTDADLLAAVRIIERLAEHQLGITDATLMALAERLDRCPVLTLDRRHFSIFRDRRGRSLRLLP
jgi:predicted nucleic acid-binding protein